MSGASVTVNGAPGENGCESEHVWERPWTLEEIHKASNNWSLGADAGLLLFLQDFSQRMLSTTHEIEKQLDVLIQDTKATDSRLHNVFNDFLMLSNIQFIENRVYDEEVEEAVKPESGGKPTEVERTREQKEAELIGKVQEAVRHGLKVLDSAFEQLDIKAGDSDSEDEEATERGEHLLEPKDLYVDRPLPYIIGSQQFMEEEDVGLGDLSSEESVDSERGSVAESEEDVREKEESDDDFDDENGEDEEKLSKSIPKQQFVSDEEDDDSDLFHESEKENDEGILTSSKRMGQISFAEELAARIQEGSPDEDRSSLTSHGSTAKSQVKTKKETQKAKQQEEGNLFGSEYADEDEDYSPFCSKSGLFSGGKGLFDDDEGDLFSEVSKEKVEESKTRPAVEGGDVFNADIIPEKPCEEGAKRKVSKLPPARRAEGLFDEEDDDLFGSKSSNAVEPKPATNLFDDSDGSGLFKASATPKIPKEKSKVPQNAEPHSEVLETSGLLAEKSQASSGLFSEDESKDLLFSSIEPSRNGSKQTAVGKTKFHPLPISFFDDDEGDLFSPVASKEDAASKKSQPQSDSKAAPSCVKSTALFDSDTGDRQSAGQPASELAVDAEDTRAARKEAPPKGSGVSPVVQKLSLFDDDPEQDNLFGMTGKESQKKSQKVSLMFEDDDEDDLFASKPAASKPAVQRSAATPQESTVLSKAVENDSVGKSRMDQRLDTKKIPPGAVPLLAGLDVFEQQGNSKLGNDAPSKPKSPSSLEESQSNRKPVVSLFDEEEDENVEDMTLQCNLVHEEKLPDSGTSTRVFQDEELLFSHHQQKDNDPDVDLFADARQPEVKKTEIKPPVMPPLSPRTKAAELPSHDLFDTTDNLFSSTKPSSAKTLSSTSNIFEDKRDEGLFSAVSIKPPGLPTSLTHMSPTKSKGASSRIAKLQANLAINPASLLPGPSAKSEGIVPGPASLASPPAVPQNPATVSKSAPGEGIGVSFNQPVQVDTLHSVNKSRARGTRKRRPPTREARRSAAQLSAEEVDQRSETDGSSVKKSVSRKDLMRTPSPEKTPPAVLSVSFGTSPDEDVDPLSAATVSLHSDLFSSGDSLKPPVPVIRKDALPKKDPVQSLFAPSDNDLFRSSKQTMKKSKPAFLDKKDGEDLFGTPKLEIAKPSTKASKSVDIFEDDLFATESVTLTKKRNERNTDVNLFDNVDIFADIKVGPKEKKSRKKMETKSIFDDDMDDIFAHASSSASAKKQVKPKAKTNQAAIPISTPEGKAANIFDDPLNAFGP